MKKFRFSLETLLKIRSQKIQLCAQELFHIAKEYTQLQNKQLMLIEEKNQLEKEIAKRRREGNLHHGMTYERYLNQLQKEILDVELEIEKKKQELIRHQEKAASAVCERKVVEKLKEKKYAEWELEAEKEIHR